MDREARIVAGEGKDMTQEDTIRMAREAGFAGWKCDEGKIERLAALAAAAQREKLAHWMRNMGYATGHGDTIEDLLDHLGTQIAEGLEAEREACAKVCETTDEPLDPSAAGNVFAAAIQARSKK
jgi:hypothetical protein